MIDLADMDADGDLDIVEFEWSVGDAGRLMGTFGLRRNHGTSREPAFAADLETLDLGGWGPFLLADLDGDCDIDILIKGPSYSSSTFFVNAGDARNPLFSGAIESFIESSDDTIVGELADFDGDGDVDHLSVSFSFGNAVRAFSYRENARLASDSRATPTFSYALEEQCHTNLSCDNPACRPFGLPCFIDGDVGDPTDIEAADLDGDGDLDLLGSRIFAQTWSGTSYEIIIYENVGTRLAPQYARPYGLGWSNQSQNSLSLGDIDADGDVDLFIKGVGTGEVQSIFFYEDIAP